MNESYSVIKVTYYREDGGFDLEGDCRSERRPEIIRDFLRTQVGQDEDKNPSNERDVYNIELKFFPESDRIEVSSNTGNKHLRDGILFKVLGKLN
jgi:hypothetical protein|tara:strand:+ start:2640 stop:2924 length:285 start_codon:yes stop_codon:yes gene_type:complete